MPLRWRHFHADYYADAATILRAPLIFTPFSLFAISYATLPPLRHFSCQISMLSPREPFSLCFFAAAAAFAAAALDLRHAATYLRHNITPDASIRRYAMIMPTPAMRCC